MVQTIQSRIVLKVFVTSLISVFAAIASSGSCMGQFSVQSGDWFDGSTWSSNTPPGVGSFATIAGGNSVTISGGDAQATVLHLKTTTSFQVPEF